MLRVLDGKCEKSTCPAEIGDHRDGESAEASQEWTLSNKTKNRLAHTYYGNTSEWKEKKDAVIASSFCKGPDKLLLRPLNPVHFQDWDTDDVRADAQKERMVENLLFIAKHPLPQAPATSSEWALSNKTRNRLTHMYNGNTAAVAAATCPHGFSRKELLGEPMDLTKANEPCLSPCTLLKKDHPPASAPNERR
mmetsp:Transcript_592/g.1304  ORF Transcript_592/g.1304 Transcript_592/m.1304 type:complete len:193 (+) Transcript_592:707-1285(+)